MWPSPEGRTGESRTWRHGRRTTSPHASRSSTSDQGRRTAIAPGSASAGTARCLGRLPRDRSARRRGTARPHLSVSPLEEISTGRTSAATQPRPCRSWRRSVPGTRMCSWASATSSTPTTPAPQWACTGTRRSRGASARLPTCRRSGRTGGTAVVTRASSAYSRERITSASGTTTRSSTTSGLSPTPAAPPRTPRAFT